MFDLHSPDDLGAMLMAMAAASVDKPEGRQKVASMLRAALVLVERGESPRPPSRVPVGATKALEEIASALGRAAEHAEFLAEKAALMNEPPP